MNSTNPILYPNVSRIPAQNDVADGQTNYAVGHGTMIAGIIARLAPGAQILPVRVPLGDEVDVVRSKLSAVHLRPLRRRCRIGDTEAGITSDLADPICQHTDRPVDQMPYWSDRSGDPIVYQAEFSAADDELKVVSASEVQPTLRSNGSNCGRRCLLSSVAVNPPGKGSTSRSLPIPICNQLTRPVSSTSIFTPVCSMMPRIVLPPGPIKSRILSVGIMRV